MRVYIIGNDGIILCREPPAAVNEGEIVVASNEELHAAQLSGKRLLALWNALPGVEKRKNCRCVTHSITSSARASRRDGIVRPRVLAAFRLMTNSNFVG